MRILFICLGTICFSDLNDVDMCIPCADLLIDTTYHVLMLGGLDRVPPMVPGELCLGGSQLAEGYINLPEKTREVFIPNPFGPGRLYRTGDMVIIREDGTIELIGRIDQQTKIDGQRVEPNEPNSIIQAQQSVVYSCVVSAIILTQKALIAIVVLKKEENGPASFERLAQN